MKRRLMHPVMHHACEQYQKLDRELWGLRFIIFESDHGWPPKACLGIMCDFNEMAARLVGEKKPALGGLFRTADLDALLEFILHFCTKIAWTIHRTECPLTWCIGRSRIGCRCSRETCGNVKHVVEIALIGQVFTKERYPPIFKLQVN